MSPYFMTLNNTTYAPQYSGEQLCWFDRFATAGLRFGG